MSDEIRLDTALLVAAWTEAILYGIFVVLLVGCLYIVGPAHKRARGAPNMLLVVTAVALFVLTTLHLGISFSRIMDAFIWSPPGSAIAYFSELSQWKEVARTGVYVTLTLTGDALFIYRCWIVWSYNWWIVVFPICLWFGSAISGYGSTVVFSELSNGDAVFTTQIAGWITSFFVVSLAQNLTVTSLIAGRIWRTNMRISKLGASSDNLWPLVAILLESGALYSSTLFVLLMLYVSNNNAQYIVLDMVDPIIGIVFSLIIVRVGLRSNSGKSEPDHRRSPTGRSVHRMSTNIYPMGQMQVKVARHIDVEAAVNDDDTVHSAFGKPSGHLSD